MKPIHAMQGQLDNVITYRPNPYRTASDIDHSSITVILVHLLRLCCHVIIGDITGDINRVVHMC